MKLKLILILLIVLGLATGYLGLSKPQIEREEASIALNNETFLK
jgi:hypothetical protein